MTISNPAAAVTVQGNGSTTQFAFDFEIPYQADGVTPAINVWINQAGVVTLLPPTAYGVSGLGEPSGGYVYYNPSTGPLPAGDSLTIVRAEWYTQPNPFPNTNFWPNNVELALDWLEMQIQQLAYEQTLDFAIQPGDTMGPWPSSAERAGTLLGFDANGNPIPVTQTGSTAGVMSFNGRSGAVALTAVDVNAVQPPMVVNEWIDPQFVIQDSSGLVTAMNDACTGTCARTTVSGYTTGSRNVTVNISGGMEGIIPGSLINFDSSADPVLGPYAMQQVIRAISTTSNTFACVPEFAGGAGGAPANSVACTCIPVQHGDFSGSGNGDITGNLSRYGNGSVSPAFWISSRPAHVSQLHSCNRVLIVQKMLSGPEIVFWQADGSYAASFGGTPRAIGMAVVVKTVNAWAQCFFSDGVFTNVGNIASANTRTWISGQRNIPVGMTTFACGVELNGPIGSTFILGEFTHCRSAVPLPDGSFSTPRAQMLRAKASLSPWNGGVMTTPANFSSVWIDVDLVQASGGLINPGCHIMHGLVEGLAGGGAAASMGDLISFANNNVNPVCYNPILRQTITGGIFYGFAGGNFNLNDNAHMWMYGTNSVSWQYLDFDIHANTLYLGP